ncbi:MAG: hypothetical protein HY455_03285 [Parcubacteria group bacterium]|nr:hypothetical protein [Parcubacteria group bacterium]
MRDAIQNFAQQFSFEPEIRNGGNFTPRPKLLIAGMGGSHLAAGLLKTMLPERDIVIHRSYGLPRHMSDLGERLFVASSYSGNTEETVSALEEALERRLPSVVISTGGILGGMAEEHSLPYIQLPKTGIQPRAAIGFAFRALLAVLSEKDMLDLSAKFANTFNAGSYEDAGRALAQMLRDSIPVIYSSEKNEALAYHWKITFNETGKIPALYNLLPELNHNEMSGFDVRDATRHLSEKFYFIFLRDGDDHPRVLKRMDILTEEYRNRGLRVLVVHLNTEGDKYTKIFSLVVLASWAAYHTAVGYTLDPEEDLPFVADFKKRMAD